MQESLIRLQQILDSVPLTKLERSEANAHLVQIQNANNELNAQLKDLKPK